MLGATLTTFECSGGTTSDVLTSGSENYNIREPLITRVPSLDPLFSCFFENVWRLQPHIRVH